MTSRATDRFRAAFADLAKPANAACVIERIVGDEEPAEIMISRFAREHSARARRIQELLEIILRPR